MGRGRRRRVRRRRLCKGNREGDCTGLGVLVCCFWTHGFGYNWIVG